MSEQPPLQRDNRSHPLAGTRMSGADIVVQVLADEGVDTIFGYSAAARSCRPTTPCFATTTVTATTDEVGSDSADRSCQRTGRRVHGVGLRPRQRQSRRRHGDVGSRRHQYRHAGARLHGRFRADRRDLRPGADGRRSAPMRFRKPRCRRSWAPSPSTFFSSPTPTKLEDTMRSAFELARTGRRARSSSTSRRTCRTGKASSKVDGTLPLPGYRRRLASAIATTASIG